MTTYTFTGRRGIDDLKGGLPEQGTEWWSKEQWDEHERLRPVYARFNRMYIDWLLRHKKYGEEYTVTFHMKHNPMLDQARLYDKEAFPLASYRMVFINMDNNG